MLDEKNVYLPTLPTGSDSREGSQAAFGVAVVTPRPVRLRHGTLVVEDVRMSAPLNLPEDLFVCIDHVGIAVPDLDAAIELYTTVFGMTVAHREVNEEQKVEEAMVQINGTGGDTTTQRIQLLAPLNDESTIAKFLDRSGPGLQQLAYRVTDVEKVSAILRERGLRLLYDAPKRGTANSRINFIHPKDAGGVLVELVEPAADH